MNQIAAMRFTVAGAKVPQPVIDALVSRMHAGCFTTSNLEDIAIQALGIHGPSRSIAPALVSRITQMGRKSGAIAPLDDQARKKTWRVMSN